MTSNNQVEGGAGIAGRAMRAHRCLLTVHRVGPDLVCRPLVDHEVHELLIVVAAVLVLHQHGAHLVLFGVLGSRIWNEANSTRSSRDLILPNNHMLRWDRVFTK